MILGLSVYIVAWAIIDPFFSIYLYSVLKSYSLAGLFYGLFFLTGTLFAVPFGDLAGRASKVKLTAILLLSYPLIGLLYFSVYLFQYPFSLIVLFLALLAHGTAASLWIAAEGFIRENSPKGETGACFGLYITFQRLAYVIAPVFIIALVSFGFSMANVNFLFLSLVPFSVLGAAIILRIKSAGSPIVQGIREVIEKDNLIKREFNDLRQLGFMGYFSLLIGFFVQSINSVIFFLVPLYALSLGLDLFGVSLLFAALSVPFLFSFFLAELADSFGKMNAVVLGFILSAVALASIAEISVASPLFFFAVFILGLILAFLQPAANGLVTDITPRIQDGEMTGLFIAVLRISGFLTSLSLGLLSDSFGLRLPFIVFALLLAAMSASSFLARKRIVVRI